MAVGCGIIVFLSLPLTFGLKETLLDQEDLYLANKEGHLGLQNAHNPGMLMYDNKLEIDESENPDENVDKYSVKQRPNARIIL